MNKLPLSLAMFVRNEERNLRDAIESVCPIVSEIVVVDGLSEDRTVEIARKYTDRVYRVPFPGSFGWLRTLTAHLANQPWIIMIDSDERVDSNDWPIFEYLINQPLGVQGNNLELDEEGNVAIDSWALPRKRWLDPWRTKQVDVASYPDWQVRLFRNYFDRPKIKFVRRVHETIDGCRRTEHSEVGPVLHHIQNFNKDKEYLARREEMYTKLYNLDIAEGIFHSEPPVLEEDKV